MRGSAACGGAAGGPALRRISGGGGHAGQGKRAIAAGPNGATASSLSYSHAANGTPLGAGALSDYVKVRTVGRGSFGEALLVQHRITGRECVLKRVRIEASNGDPNGAAENALREVQVLRRLQHPCIVEFLGAFADPRDTSGGTLCLLMAYCEGGDLQQRLLRVRNEARRLAEELVLRWFDQLCNAVSYVHSRQVLHRDLKPSNIFLTGGCRSSNGEREEESVALGDFGVSRPLAHALELVTTMVGTPCYLSPEVCRGRPYSYKSDIWSLGCVLFEMTALRPPFGQATNLEALVSQIVRAEYVVPESVPENYPEAIRCVKAMLRLDADRRPTAQALLNRPRLRAAGEAREAPPAANRGASPAHGQAVSTRGDRRGSAAGRCGSADHHGGGDELKAHSPARSPAAAAAAAAARHAAEAANAAVAAALCPKVRAQNRERLARRILQSEAEQENVNQAWNDIDPVQLGAGQPRGRHAPAPAGHQQPRVSGAHAVGGPRRRGTSNERRAEGSPGAPSSPRGSAMPSSNGGNSPSTAAKRGLSLPAQQRRGSVAGKDDAPRRPAAGGVYRRRSDGRTRSPPAPEDDIASPGEHRGVVIKTAADQRPRQRAVIAEEPRIVRSPPGAGTAAAGTTAPVGTAAAGSPGSAAESSSVTSPRSPADSTVGGLSPGSPLITKQPMSARMASDSGSVEPPLTGRNGGFPPDPRLKRRREDRVQQSQAFREWLQKQRAGVSTNMPHSPVPPSTPATPAASSTAATPCHPVNIASRGLGAASVPSERRTEIYCPGFGMMALAPEDSKVKDVRTSGFESHNMSVSTEAIRISAPPSPGPPPSVRSPGGCVRSPGSGSTTSPLFGGTSPFGSSVMLGGGPHTAWGPSSGSEGTMQELIAGGTDASTTLGVGGSAMLGHHTTLKAAESLSPPETLWAAATGTLVTAASPTLQHQQLQHQQSRSLILPVGGTCTASIAHAAPQAAVAAAQNLQSQVFTPSPEAYSEELLGLDPSARAVGTATSSRGGSVVLEAPTPSEGELPSHTTQLPLAAARNGGGPIARCHVLPSQLSASTKLATGGSTNGSAGVGCEDAADDNDADDGIVSIGDRIEGIRACLEARLGTQRFQMLYKSLSSDDEGLAAAVALANVGPPPRITGGDGEQLPGVEMSTALPEELSEVFAEAGAGNPDIGSLAPLVAKLVACEHSYFS